MVKFSSYIFYLNEDIIPNKSGQEIIVERKRNDQSTLAFGNILWSSKWEDIYSERNPNEAYDRFIRSFSKAYDSSFPDVQIKNKTKPNP